jgi:hypothetical protein
MESLGYVWLYLLRGSLPWMGLTGRNQRHKYDRICEVKAQTSFEELCRGFPIEFVRYFQTVRNLRFTETPNYAELRQIFRDLFIKEGYLYDYKYDWVRDAAPVALPGPIGSGEPEQRPDTARAEPGTARNDTRAQPWSARQRPSRITIQVPPLTTRPAAEDTKPQSAMMRGRGAERADPREPTATDRRARDAAPITARRPKAEPTARLPKWMATQVNSRPSRFAYKS